MFEEGIYVIELERAIQLAKEHNSALDLWAEYKTLFVFSNSTDEDKRSSTGDTIIVLKHNGEFRPFSNWSAKYPETLSMAQFIKNGAC